MRYPALWKYINDQPEGRLIVFDLFSYPEAIKIPAVGFAVQDSGTSAWAQTLGPGTTPEARQYAEDWFDAIIEKALSQFGSGMFSVQRIPAESGIFRYLYSPVEVFADREYAMGYAHGARTDTVYDLSTDRFIKRKV